jgi:hypothetical protein
VEGSTSGLVQNQVKTSYNISSQAFTKTNATTSTTLNQMWTF